MKAVIAGIQLQRCLQNRHNKLLIGVLGYADPEHP